MATKKSLPARILASFVFLTFAVLQPSMQQRMAEGLDGMIATDDTPTAFLIASISLTGEGSVLLTWSDLGPDFVYTVEFSDSMSGRWDRIPPVEQWPTGSIRWTDTSAAGSGTRFYRIHTEALSAPPIAPTDVTAEVQDGKVVIAWSLVPGASSYNVYWSTDEEFSPLDASKMEGVTSPFTHTALTYDIPYYYVVTAVGNMGESEVSDVVVATPVSSLDPTVATTLAAASEFLYTGGDPLQTGVAEGTIEPTRVAVLRGKVLTRDEQPLSGVTITVLNHPEYGQTLSREDGMFDMAANGGGYLTVDYQKDGYLPAQRQVNVPWQDYVWLPDVVLIQQDSQVTTIDLNEPTEMQEARGSVQSDDDGTRQARVLFPQGTQAEMVMPDGSTQAITTLSVRATEYTVGPNGPQAMPAELPPTSFYTYCVEFNADEALAAGAKDVVFSQPLYFYVENFLGFPAGIQVPVGCYDRTKGVWVPSPDGKVIKILSIAGSMADLDTDGDEVADDTATLEAIGITDAERQKLADLYSAGQSLWRVPVPHFSQPYDCNYGTVPEPGATPFTGDPATTGDEDNTDKPCQDSNWGTIEFQNQVFKEAVSVTGTPFRLHYSSDRVPGYIASNTLNVPLSTDSIPPSLVRIDLQLLVGGRQFTESFSPLPGQSHTFVWDGKDAYGRLLQGEQPVTVRVGYVYNSYYALPPYMSASFGFPSGRRVPGNIPAREPSILWRNQNTHINLWDALSLGLGGWTLSIHHAYDPQGCVLYLGDGRRRSIENMNSIITTVAGGGDPPTGLGDGGPATEAKLSSPRGIAVGPDGSLYIADTGYRRVRRVGPDGIITTVAGRGGSYYNGDGIPATDANLCPQDVDVGPDGSLYIVDTCSSRIRRVGLDGIITTVAGSGSDEYNGDGGLATEAGMDPDHIAVGPDGNIYISDASRYPEGYRHSVRRVGPDGIITSFAGTGDSTYMGEDGPASEASLNPICLDVGPDGSLYIVIDTYVCIARVTPDGILRTVAGTGERLPTGDGGPAIEAGMKPYGIAVSPDGCYYIAEPRIPNNKRIRRVGPDGIITTVAGGGTPEYPDRGDDGPATAADVVPWYVATGPDGSLYIGEPNASCIRRVAPAMPGFSTFDILIPSEDGSMVYYFDPNGRHLKTLNALTGATLYEFGYDVNKWLITVTDASGNVTTIERDAGGNPTAIVSPFGQRTALNLDNEGYLENVTNPAGETTLFSYFREGLLTTVTTPKKTAYSFDYDALGRLITAEDPAEGSSSLTRTEMANGREVERSTKLGRITTYRVERLSTGENLSVNTAACGLQTETLAGTDGVQTVHQPDGTVTNLAMGPDPRFGMQAPIAKGATVTTPGGLNAIASTARSVTMADPEAWMGIDTLTETFTLNGRVFASIYDTATHTFTDTTPEGRQITTVTDAHSRLMEFRASGLEPVRYVYDNRGRLTEMSQGAGAETRPIVFNFHDDTGYLRTLTDPLGRTWHFEYDLAGRMTLQTLPGGEIVQYGYDANGSGITLTPPGRPAHTFSYTSTELLESYTPPALDIGNTDTSYAYNSDGQPERITRPDASTVDFAYDDAGRLSTLAYPGSSIDYTYDEATGNVDTIIGPDGTSLSYSYDGSLLTLTTWGGAVSGNVGRAYDNNLRVTSRSVNGQAVAFQHDDDDLIIQAGDLAVTRDTNNGLVLGTSLGKVTDTWGRNAFGEVATYSSAYDGSVLQIADYTYDKAGRLVQKTETIGGSTDTYIYSYNLAGALREVKKNDTTVAIYSYDSNGNRLSYTGPGGTLNGNYDAQDRLLEYGDTSYEYTPSGELLTKTSSAQTTTYDYDALGNLKKVVVPSGQQIEYVVDGIDRRIGKRVDGTLVSGFLYRDHLHLIAELDGTNNVVSRFVYGTRSNVPDYMLKGGETYRIIADHLGSPRLVINTQDGTVAQRIDYDEFGGIIQDTNPGFQPFGFAGGLYDPDTRLVRFGARDYDPEIGRWTAKDPIGFMGGSLNLYSYVMSDPLNFVDPEGLGSGWQNPWDMLKPDYTHLSGNFWGGLSLYYDANTGQPYWSADAGTPGVSLSWGWALRKRVVEGKRPSSGDVKRMLTGVSFGGYAACVVHAGLVYSPSEGWIFELGFGGKVPGGAVAYGWQGTERATWTYDERRTHQFGGLK